MINQSESQIALDKFILEMKRLRKSKQTIKNYSNKIQLFLKNYNKQLFDIKSEDVYDFLKKFYSNKKKSTVLNITSILRSFFNYCLQENIINGKNPVENWISLKDVPENEHVIKSLDDKELAKARQAASFFSLKERLIIKVLECTGIRRSEASSIDISSINHSKRNIKVLVKGGKTITVNYSVECEYLLKQYLKIHPGSGALFLNRSGKRLSDKGIYRVIKKLGEKANIENLHPHRFRHTFITNFLLSGAHHFYVSKATGQKSEYILSNYSKLPKHKLLEIFDTCMR